MIARMWNILCWFQRSIERLILCSVPKAQTSISMELMTRWWKIVAIFWLLNQGKRSSLPKNNSLCDSLPLLSAAFWLLYVFTVHCSDWQRKYRSLCSATWMQLHKLFLVMKSLLHNSEKSKCTFPGKLKGITFNRRITNAKGRKNPLHSYLTVKGTIA